MRVLIDIQAQQLKCIEAGKPTATYPVSTALKGTGQAKGSECTPLGEHLVRARIGCGLPPGAVLVGRIPTGEIYGSEMARAEPQRDWILTRILWLGGLEHGKNHGGAVDTTARYIYIHGAPDEVPMGIAGSHGCVRMRNPDIIELFDRVRIGTRVDIVLRESSQ